MNLLPSKNNSSILKVNIIVKHESHSWLIPAASKHSRVRLLFRSTMFLLQLIIATLRYITYPADVQRTLHFEEQVWTRLVTEYSAKYFERCVRKILTQYVKRFSSKVKLNLFQKFPHITFCNFNMLKWHVVRNDSNFAEIKELMDQYYAIRFKNDTASPDKYSFRVGILETLDFRWKSV